MNGTHALSPAQKRRLALEEVLVNLDETEDLSDFEDDDEDFSDSEDEDEDDYSPSNLRKPQDQNSKMSHPSDQDPLPAAQSDRPLDPVPTTPKEIVTHLLANATDLSVVTALVAPDATYLSLNASNPELQRILPWTGLHTSRGPAGIHATFTRVAEFWEILAFDTTATFGEGEDVAVFGTFRYQSRTLGLVTESPFCVWAKVRPGADGRLKVVWMQFMEDTLGTANSFRREGRVIYEADPRGGEVVVEVGKLERGR